MAKKRRKINGKYEHLPEGVTLEPVRGEEKLVHYFMENGKRKRKYYPATDEGLRAVKKAAGQMEKEKREHGERFGALSTDEKQAVEIWRTYRDECMREACDYAPMSDVVREALELFRQRSISPLFREVVTEYVLGVERKGVCVEHRAKVNQRARMLDEFMGDVRVCSITPLMVEEFLNGLRGRDGGACAPATRRGYMVLLGAIFRHAIRRGYVAANPLQALQQPIVRSREPETLSVEVCRAIVQYTAENEVVYLPGLVLALFCGVRPAELARVRYSDLFPGGRAELFLSRDITKTNVDRISRLRPNVIAWLDYAREQGVSMEPEEYVLPGDTEERRVGRNPRFLKRIAIGCGVEIPRDALRHTTGTMLSALIGKAAAAEELGNDVRTLTRHYRHAVTKGEAKAFYAITPD